MTTSLYQDIRGALQTLAASATGFPAAGQRAFENLEFSSTTGTPWVRMTVKPTSGRPYSVDAITRAHAGLFLVDFYFPADQGTAGKPAAGDGEPAVDHFKDLFAPGTKIPLTGGEILYIAYAERAQGIAKDGQFMIPVTVAWRCWSARN